MGTKECRSCGSSHLISVLDLGDQPWCNDLVTNETKSDVKIYPLHMVMCSDCSMLQLNHTVPKEVMFKEHGYLSGMTQTLKDHFRTIARENIDTFRLSKEDLIVDIGGNDGTQLIQYRTLGMENLVNVESADNIAQISKDAGIATVNKFFNEETVDKHFEPGTAKIINAAGVFFHLEELHSVTRGIKKLLAPDGVFTVQFMYAGEMVRGGSYDMIYHEHLNYYTLATLNDLLNAHGLTVFDAYYSKIHSGSIIARASHPGQYETTERCVGAFRDDKVFTKKRFEAFAEDIKKNRYTLRDLLISIKDEGHSIWAYGAPAKGNTLLNYEGITNALVEKAVEINPLKVGKILPVTNIPIELETKDSYPDYYLLLSHNFEKEILKKNEDFLNRGGKFILPFPTPRIIGRDECTL